MTNLGAVLVTGLLAGGVSCAAVQGGLLAGLVARQRGEASPSGGGSRKKADKVATGAAATKATATGAAATKATAAKVRAGKAAAKTAGHAAAGSVLRRFGDDIAPVGGFLAGKLVSHTALGLLLGAIGSAAQLSPRVTAWTQIAAGVLIVVFALAQLGVPGFSTIGFEPPASWNRFVRGRARATSALAPAALGAATVLIPCGVTISVMALAITSGSPLAGAATMAVFVIGTSPLFAALGYLARKAATAWRGRLALAAGLVVLLVGLYTLNTGLVRVGSPITARSVAQAAGLVAEPATGDTVTLDSSGRQEVVVTAVTGAYLPANVAVKAGVPTTLVVRSRNAQGCVRAFVIPELGKQVTLPAEGDTRIDLGTLEPGTMTFSCSMGMYTGQLTIS